MERPTLVGHEPYENDSVSQRIIPGASRHFISDTYLRVLLGDKTHADINVGAPQNGAPKKYRSKALQERLERILLRGSSLFQTHAERLERPSYVFPVGETSVGHEPYENDSVSQRIIPGASRHFISDTYLRVLLGDKTHADINVGAPQNGAPKRLVLRTRFDKTTFYLES